VPDEEPLAPEAPAGPPRRAVVRFLLLALILGAGFAALRFTPLRDQLTREALAATLASLRDAWWSPFLLGGLYLVLAPLGLPMSPLVFAGGVVFGFTRGSLYNLGGLFVGAVASFLLARGLGRELIAHYLGERLRRVERMVSRQGFWALVRLRLLPLPFALVNYGVAFAGVKLPRFLVATAIGLVPTTLLYTWIAATLAHAAAGDRGEVARNALLAIAALAAASLLPNLVTAVRRRQRYRDLKTQRGGRG
jgi:uncharacterized membrane protein YdjX (TVP38/TMEM64 family)